MGLISRVSSRTYRLVVTRKKMSNRGERDEEADFSCKGEGQISLKCARMYSIFSEKILGTQHVFSSGPCKNLQENYKKCGDFWKKYCEQKQTFFAPAWPVREQIVNYMKREFDDAPYVFQKPLEDCQIKSAKFDLNMGTKKPVDFGVSGLPEKIWNEIVKEKDVRETYKAQHIECQFDPIESETK